MQRFSLNRQIFISVGFFITCITMQAMKRDDLIYGQRIFGGTGKQIFNEERLHGIGLEQLSKFLEIFLKGGALGCHIRDRQGHDLTPMVPVIVMDENRQYCIGRFNRIGDLVFKGTPIPHRTVYIYVELPGNHAMAYTAEEAWISAAGFDALKFTRP